LTAAFRPNDWAPLTALFIFSPVEVNAALASASR
jgi:hypothetical protein